MAVKSPRCAQAGRSWWPPWTPLPGPVDAGLSCDDSLALSYPPQAKRRFIASAQFRGEDRIKNPNQNPKTRIGQPFILTLSTASVSQLW